MSTIALARLLVGCFVVCGGGAGETVVVEVDSGRLRGTVEVSVGGRTYYAFRGVPYAQPPIGPRRFQPPERVEAWEGVRNVTEHPPICIQTGVFPRPPGVYGNEDCLYLNVFTPSIQGQDMPVMFWVHGGGFNIASPQSQGPDYLMDRDVVLVTIQYRLGIFGFLSTEDEACPGNYGMLDQVEALKWVARNIRAFGGHPDKVTLFGNSAGGASVHLLMLSPLTQGLFRSGISQSGTSLGHWVLQGPGKARERADLVASLVGCPTDSTLNLLECLRGTDAFTLTQATASFWVWSLSPIRFSPRVDAESREPFLPRSPQMILESGDFHRVPWMTGITREEGLWLALEAVIDESLWRHLDENWRSKYCPAILGLEDDPEACDEIRFKYLKDLPIDRDSISDINRLLGDRWFGVPAQQALKLHSRWTETYAYSFEYEGEKNIIDFWLAEFLQNGGLKPHGACHTDETLYMFKNPVLPPIVDGSDFLVRTRVMDLWLNFTHHGKPQLKPPAKNEHRWLPWTEADDRHYVIELYPRLGRNLVPMEILQSWEGLESKRPRVLDMAG